MLWQPNASGIRVFRARAYVDVPNQGRYKLDSSTKAGTFLGYEANSIAYLMVTRWWCQEM